MKQDQETLELLMENIGCGIFTVDNERRITSWNRAAAEITGFASSEMLGKRCCSLKCLNCIRGAEGEAEECQVFREGNIGPQECVLARADGSTVRVLKSGRLLYDKEGKLLGAVESLTDISSIRSEFNELFQDTAGKSDNAFREPCMLCLVTQEFHEDGTDNAVVKREIGAGAGGFHGAKLTNSLL